MTSYVTWAVLDTGKVVKIIEPVYHPEWAKAPDTTYIKFQEPVTTED